jgi:hypothetical protein
MRIDTLSRQNTTRTVDWYLHKLIFFDEGENEARLKRAVVKINGPNFLYYVNLANKFLDHGVLPSQPAPPPTLRPSVRLRSASGR